MCLFWLRVYVHLDLLVGNIALLGTQARTRVLAWSSKGGLKLKVLGSSWSDWSVILSEECKREISKFKAICGMMYISWEDGLYSFGIHPNLACLKLVKQESFTNIQMHVHDLLNMQWIENSVISQNNKQKNSSNNNNKQPTNQQKQ